MNINTYIMNKAQPTLFFFSLSYSFVLCLIHSCKQKKKPKKKPLHVWTGVVINMRAAWHGMKWINTSALRDRSSWICVWVSDSLWHEGRDIEAWLRILRGQKANGYLNSCRSPALKHVIPADKLPTEGPATTVMKLSCWEFMKSAYRKGLNRDKKNRA